MRFQFTLSMASRAGSPVHQVLGEHPAKSLSELLEVICDNPFIMVEEIYKDSEAGRNGSFYGVGELLINTNVIGKVKVHRD